MTEKMIIFMFSKMMTPSIKNDSKSTLETIPDISLIGTLWVHTPFPAGQPVTYWIPFSYPYGMGSSIYLGEVLNLF